jgi:hypothetical protein
LCHDETKLSKSNSVTAGLVPAIHVLVSDVKKGADAPDKRGHDRFNSS